jgi:hypothetical protein
LLLLGGSIIKSSGGNNSVESKEPAEKNCHSCKNFYITWEKEFPYGCRVMDFKSARLPSLEVEEADGQACLAHELKSGLERSTKKKRSRSRFYKAQSTKVNIEV